MAKVGVLGGHPPFPHVDSQGLTAVLLPEGPPICSMGGVFLGALEQTRVNAKEAQECRKLTIPTETLIPAGGTVYASSSGSRPSIN